MSDLTPEQTRRLHDFAEQLAELAEHQEDRWMVQTTDGQIVLTMMSPTAHGLNVVRLRRQIEGYGRHGEGRRLPRCPAGGGGRLAHEFPH
ncbi:hypothetical protein [Streptomyces sp. NPDC091268]|uniref:hypothetical protein n=1 Tax=Streptomyces sp. NPDC091268 TaxID=3365979 RepID=UPI00382A6884